MAANIRDASRTTADRRLTGSPKATLITLRVAEVEKEWFTTEEACKYLGIKPRTLTTWKSTGKLRFYSLEPDNMHARTFIRKRDLDKLLKPVI